MGLAVTELDQSIQAAFKSEGKELEVNKVYLILLSSVLFVPVKKESATLSEEPFEPLFTVIDQQHFMPAFDQLARLDAWAGEYRNEMDYVELQGRDLIRGVNEKVFLCLNMGTPFYKEFSPEEVKRLKMIVTRIDNFKN